MFNWDLIISSLYTDSFRYLLIQWWSQKRQCWVLNSLCWAHVLYYTTYYIMVSDGVIKSSSSAFPIPPYPPLAENWDFTIYWTSLFLEYLNLVQHSLFRSWAFKIVLGSLEQTDSKFAKNWILAFRNFQRLVFGATNIITNYYSFKVNSIRNDCRISFTFSIDRCRYLKKIDQSIIHEWFRVIFRLRNIEIT